MRVFDVPTPFSELMPCEYWFVPSVIPNPITISSSLVASVLVKADINIKASGLNPMPVTLKFPVAFCLSNETIFALSISKTT
jgi:hypothetical protein